MIVLVVAKAPVPGLAKTRLIPALGRHGAADLAAAALLDTLDVAAAAAREFGSRRPVVALAGDVALAARSREVAAALAGCDVVPQRGAGFAQRLVNAHRDAAPKGFPLLQIGMDTPQVTVELLTRSAALLSDSEAVVGPAEDGGWWLLGLRCPTGAEALQDVPMSTAETGQRTREALQANELQVKIGPGLRDVDTIEDARAVAELVPGSRFATVLQAALGAGVPA